VNSYRGVVAKSIELVAANIRRWVNLNMRSDARSESGLSRIERWFVAGS
jgi:hypothetical protein